MTKIKINQNIISLGIYIVLCYSLKNQKRYVAYLGQSMYRLEQAVKEPNTLIFKNK